MFVAAIFLYCFVLPQCPKCLLCLNSFNAYNDIEESTITILNLEIRGKALSIDGPNSEYSKWLGWNTNLDRESDLTYRTMLFIEYQTHTQHTYTDMNIQISFLGVDKRDIYGYFPNCRVNGILGRAEMV